jgi:hypothetical protein
MYKIPMHEWCVYRFLTRFDKNHKFKSAMDDRGIEATCSARKKNENTANLKYFNFITT